MKVISISIVLTFLFATTIIPAAFGEEELIVSAAASLTISMKEVAKKFQESNKDIKVVLNFASSGSLLQQMIHGAPVDVFASANQKFMEKAHEKKLIIQETRVNFVKNKLVLVTPNDAKLNIKTVAELSSPEIKRIALGNPDHVPAGRYARESLKAYGLWDKLTDKYIFANSVRQVLDYLLRGEVDAGLFYSTDAISGKDKIKVITELGKHKPIIYPIAVLAASEKKDAAKRFVNFVSGDQGLKIFMEYGFHKP